MRIEPVKPPERLIEASLWLDLELPEFDFDLPPQTPPRAPSPAEVAEALQGFNAHLQPQQEGPSPLNTEPPKRHRDEEVKPELGGIIW